MKIETIVLHVWRGAYRPRGTLERPYAHTEEYVVADGVEIVLTDSSIAWLTAKGYELYYPVRG